MAPGCGRPRQVVAGPGGCMQSRCGPCTGACAPSPMPRLLRPVPAFPVFCCPRPVARVLRSAFCVLRSASCTPCPRARARVRVRVHVFRVLRPAPHARVFRVPHPRPRTPHPRPRTLRPVPAFPVFCCPRPRCPALCARGPAPASPAPRARAPVFCVPQTVARVPRPISPPTLRDGSFRLRHAAGMKRKSGGSPQEPPDFACIAAARLTRACG